MSTRINLRLAPALHSALESEANEAGKPLAVVITAALLDHANRRKSADDTSRIIARLAQMETAITTHIDALTE
ncbi:MAG: hypothetical protein Q8O25_08245 [Sulfurisoma sp.]|nr:hypothetical protein [Sulfurisoma sp.]